ncbi:MAG: polysaccharide deacetylase family protein [Thermobispora bispora]|uniref:polysaccharide deacetylase family protein n=1 Tax=Thermobispora bispora TaxID=2006 RepID=UPI00197CF605|nr:polysaccharide deacetylase family protein [Thermobispora bispora]MBO2473255.1 polysaccharide deacetylase [Actinomycetales bacterium]MBX6167758.1 polysaccharide deacetylase family protein [Thermobispora bispora]MDI9580676.1 polysaccharide deacetylase family protein [Thermobispora sp.]QSI46633.1 polysaccharide deacetylase [Thermobispora bispora]
MGRIRVAGLGLVCLTLAAACSSGGDDAAKREDPQVQAKKMAAEANARKAAMAAAARVKANELGQIPVIMYHRVVKNPPPGDDLSPEQFRAELERLAAEKYVPITAAEYVTGKIDIPAGMHPVVLTFDDASPSQVALDGMGNPLPDSAVGILLDVAKKYPHFRPVATFFVTRDLFGKTRKEEQMQVLQWLKDHGFDIGNHTKDHVNLLGKSREQVAEAIAAGQAMVTELINTPPVTLALPYGNQPSKKEWALQGKAKSGEYKLYGAFLAGYTPAASPFSKDFDPAGIPRIRSKEKVGDCKQFCSAAWLDWLKANPSERYTSDGNPNTVAFPKFKAPFAAPAYASRALPY